VPSNCQSESFRRLAKDALSTGPELHAYCRTARFKDLAAYYVALDVLPGATGLFGQRFGKHPELPDRHFEVTANREHDITGSVCLTAFYPAQIEVAIPERSRQTGL
jgi:hypothetical protein